MAEGWAWRIHFKKKTRMPQKYRIKCYEDTVMASLEADIEMAPVEEAEDETNSAERDARDEREQLSLDDSEEDDDEDDRQSLDREDDEEASVAGDGNVELDSEEDDDETVTVGGVFYIINAKRRRVTVADEDPVGLEMGNTVTAGEYRWERVRCKIVCLLFHNNTNL
jgi:hypothetical protein